jgi:hypothetical protein
VNIGGRKLRPPLLDFTSTANDMATKKEQFFLEEQKILNRIYAELYGVDVGVPKLRQFKS